MNADTKTHFQYLIGKYAHVNGKPMNIDPISIRLKPAGAYRLVADYM